MRLRNKFFIFFLGFLLSQEALAQVDRSPLNMKAKSPQFDLLKENESITVLKEDSVQTYEPESRHLVGFYLGAMSANNLTLSSNNTITHYDLSKQTPSLGGAFGYYPAKFDGYWGLLSSISYSFQEQGNAGAADSALHMISTDALISYRLERSANSWVKPFIGIGPGVNIVIQRGIDQLNTSEAKGLLVGALGVGLNAKRLFDMSTPLEWEVTVEYKRWMDIQPSNGDYNGQVVSLGFSMIL